MRKRNIIIVTAVFLVFSVVLFFVAVFFNSFDNIIGANSWNSIGEGNYWNDYQGQDLDHNGIGDTPHIINAINQDNFPLTNSINIETEPQPQVNT